MQTESRSGSLRERRAWFPRWPAFWRGPSFQYQSRDVLVYSTALEVAASRLWERITEQTHETTNISRATQESFPESQEEGLCHEAPGSLYRMKDAAKIWNRLLLGVLCRLRFKEGVTAPCSFAKGGIVVLCYVDDLFLFAKDEWIIDKIKAGLSTRFRFKNLEIPT